MKKELTLKEQLLKEFDNENYKFAQVFIEMPDYPLLEVINNGKENFPYKKEYYGKAYNDNLELISFPKIKIVDWEFYEMDEENYARVRNNWNKRIGKRK